MSRFNKKRGAEPPEKKNKKPKTFGEAKELIEETFAAQPLGGWDERNQAVYFALIGVSGKESQADVRRIIENLAAANMIIF